MIKTYQYKWTPVTQANLNNFVGPNCTPVPVSEFLVNIEADESIKGDLDAYMTQISYEYVGEIV